MAGKQVTELDALPSFTDNSLLPVHNGAGLKKGLLSQLASYLGTKFSNPNLLINPDFKINQRGEATYTKDNQGQAIYTVDRWILWNGTLEANSMLLKAYGSSPGLLVQRLENKINGIATVSFQVSSILGTLTALARGTSGNTLGEISVTQKGIYQFTATGEISDITFTVSAGGSVAFAWAKLEHGSIATSFIAPNMAEELDKCLRYFQTYENIAFIPELLSVSDVSKSATNYVPLYMIFAQQMRVKPTATYKSIINRSGTVISGNHSITVDNKGLTGLKLSSSSTYHTIYANKLTLDAEIY